MSENGALINYYARNGFTRTITNLCNESLRKRGVDPILVFWRSYAVGVEGEEEGE